MFRLILTVLNRESSTPCYNPYSGLVVQGGTSQGNVSPQAKASGSSLSLLVSGSQVTMLSSHELRSFEL